MSVFEKNIGGEIGYYGLAYWWINTFEKKELLALFGDQYSNYKKQVPSIFPFLI